MDTRLLLAPMLALFSCASWVPGLPACPSINELKPPASDECLATPEAGSTVSRMASLLEPQAGPLLIRVEMSAASSVESVCGDRSNTRGERQARKHLSEVSPSLASLPSGPSCLAGTRLDFNRSAAHAALVASSIRQCRREASRELEASRNNPSNPSQVDTVRSGRAYLDCLTRRQMELEEIWFFDRFVTTRFVVFIPAEGSARRRKAIRICSDPLETDPFSDQPAVARLDEGLVDCMSSQGWQPVR